MANKKNVGEILAKHREIRSYVGDDSFVLPNDFIGIEIELEGLPHIPELRENSLWSIHTDNSLRSSESLRSAELVLKFPLCGKDLKMALEEFNTIITSLPTPPITSERTSVHIHVDARDMSVDELYKLIVIYCIFERVFFKFCGEGREDNNFCLPFYRAEGEIFENIGDINKIGLKEFTKRLEGQYRYSALNLCSLLKFGSIEFRHCGGTYDIGLIKDWINILLKLKKYTKDASSFNLNTFPTYISDLGYSPIVNKVFEEYAPKLLYLNIKEDILLGIRQAQKIIYSGSLNKVKNLLGGILFESVTNTSTIKKYMEAKRIKAPNNEVPQDASRYYVSVPINEERGRSPVIEILQGATTSTPLRTEWDDGISLQIEQSVTEQRIQDRGLSDILGRRVSNQNNPTARRT